MKRLLIILPALAILIGWSSASLKAQSGGEWSCGFVPDTTTQTSSFLCPLDDSLLVAEMEALTLPPRRIRVVYHLFYPADSAEAIDTTIWATREISNDTIVNVEGSVMWREWQYPKTPDSSLFFPSTEQGKRDFIREWLFERPQPEPVYGQILNGAYEGQDLFTSVNYLYNYNNDTSINYIRKDAGGTVLDSLSVDFNDPNVEFVLDTVLIHYSDTFFYYMGQGSKDLQYLFYSDFIRGNKQVDAGGDTIHCELTLEQREAALHMFAGPAAAAGVQIGIARRDSMLAYTGFGVGSPDNAVTTAHELGHLLWLNHVWEDDPNNTIDRPNFSTACQDYGAMGEGPMLVMDGGAGVFRRRFDTCEVGFMNESIFKDEVSGWINNPLCEYDSSLQTVVGNGDSLIVSDARVFFSDVVVESGGYFRAGCRALFPAGAGLIVRPGGEAVLGREAVLTNGCPDKMWRGAVVLGSDSTDAAPGLNGKIELRSGSCVEHAEIGLRNYEGTSANPQQAGGLIEITAHADTPAVFHSNGCGIVLRKAIPPTTIKNLRMRVSYPPAAGEMRHFDLRYPEVIGPHILLDSISGVQLQDLSINNGGGFQANEATFFTGYPEYIDAPGNEARRRTGILLANVLDDTVSLANIVFTELHTGVEVNGGSDLALRQASATDTVDFQRCDRGIRVYDRDAGTQTVVEGFNYINARETGVLCEALEGADVEVRQNATSERTYTYPVGQFIGFLDVAPRKGFVARDLLNAEITFGSNIARESETGILAQNFYHSDVTIRFNEVTGCETGVRARGRDGAGAVIEHNEIDSAQTGIFADAEVVSYRPVGNGVSAPVYADYPIVADRNEITNSLGAGIRLANVTGVARLNTIKDFAGDAERFYGIQVLGGTGCYVTDNVITDTLDKTGAQRAHGIFLSQAREAVVGCNEVSGFADRRMASGITISGDCSGLTAAHNELEMLTAGMLYYMNGVSGPQVNPADTFPQSPLNRFIDNTHGLASIMSVPGAIGDDYYYPSDTLNLKPASVAGLLTDWAVDMNACNTPPASFTCPPETDTATATLSSANYCSGGQEEGPTGYIPPIRYFHDVAQGNLNFLFFEDENVYFAERHLLRTLRVRDTLLDGDPILQNFVDAKENTVMESLLDVEDYIYNGDLDSAETLNQSLLATNDIEEMQIGFNTVLLDFRQGDADTLTAAQESELDSIAAFCPIYAGEVVYQAAGLLSLANDRTFAINFECDTNWTSPRIAQPEIEGKDVKENRLSIYPNPSERDFTLRYDLAEKGTIQLEIFDMMGRRLSSANLNGRSGENRILTAGWAPGLYVCKCLINGSELRSFKLLLK